MFDIEMDEYKEEMALREREYQREQQQRTATLRSRAQWRGAGFMVIVSDDEAVKTITCRNGNLLRLYDESQTRPRTPQELERDKWRG